MIKYIDRGYTHLVSWEEWNKNLQMFVEKHFPTTPDAVDIHVNSLKERPGVVRNIKATPLKDM